VHYATFHLPPEPNGFYRYNALQQLAYFGVVFLLAPLAILTGPSMSPALTNRFVWYPKLPGNRQIGRSLHFLIMCAFVLFFVSHVAMVALTGLVRNMNHIVIGADDGRLTGLYLGLLGIGVVVAVNALANWLAWRHPRLVQHVAKKLVTPVMSFLLDRPAPVAEFRPQDVSPFFWANGKTPTSHEWTALADGHFVDYRLRVCGLVANPVELSLDDLRALPHKTQITLHHCIQGWSGVAAWGGLPLADLVALARPTAAARAVVFYSFGEGGEGGEFYDSLSLDNARHPQTLLAYDMNDQPLGILHGAPLRLRVENQLGFKMVKWIRAIEFVADVRAIGQGEGGYNEDHEYFGELANI
jgi:DMSO/TMAO reductase YedYZ molybdopterin-dependent catalytic subunit